VIASGGVTLSAMPTHSDGSTLRTVVKAAAGAVGMALIVAAVLIAPRVVQLSQAAPAPASLSSRDSWLTAAVPPTALTIMTIGDSINTGLGSADGCGYRTELGRLLGLAGVAVTWKGDLWTTGPAQCPIRYGHHGATVQELRHKPSIPPPNTIEAYMAADQPDAVLIMTGTNNAMGAPPGMANFGADYADLVGRIYAAKPGVKVFYAWIPYGWHGSWVNNQVLVNQFSYTSLTGGSYPQAIMVDLSHYPPCLMLDGIHPSNYDGIGRVWYTALATAYGLTPGPANADAWRPGSWRPGVERQWYDRGC